MAMGRIHSWESMGLVDGPGIRTVIFLQGCRLRCRYCHNPDTWELCGKGTLESPEETVNRLMRFKPYYGADGGVTFSGGEPLLQKEFLTEVLALCKSRGIHTCLDTAGVGCGGYGEILKNTDLVLLDVKHYTPEGYQAVTSRSMDAYEEFLDAVQSMEVPLWLRHVVVPGLTDSPENLAAIYRKAKRYSNLKKIEWLPFHTMCLEKYRQMGIPFPLEGTPPMDAEKLKELTAPYAV